MRWNVMRTAVLAGFLAVAGGVAQAQHEGDIWVGRTSNAELTRGGLNVDANILQLAPTAGGWVDSDPGIDHVVNPVPGQDILPLEPGATIQLEVVALDPALKVIQVGTFIVLDSPGDRFTLRPAGPNPHEHPLWFIDEEDPAYDPAWAVWHGTFRLVDIGGTGYANSTEFTLKFTNRELLIGDVNCDGALSVSDIAPFVSALTAPQAYAAAFPDCDILLADTTDDGQITVSDIAGFVALLTGG